jgi:hypothetical protein
VTASLLGIEIMPHRLGGRSRARRKVREHPAVLLDSDLELVALEENPVFIPTA